MDGYTYEMYEVEQERLKRLARKREIEEEMEDDYDPDSGRCSTRDNGTA